jgi:hypothetical protein
MYSQPGNHCAQRKPAYPVSPVDVVDRDQQRCPRGNVFEVGRDPVG